MTADQLHAAALIVSAFAALAGVMWAIYAGPGFWERREAAKRARTIFRPADRSWGWTPDFEDGEPDPDGLTVVADAVGVLNDRRER